MNKLLITIVFIAFAQEIRAQHLHHDQADTGVHRPAMRAEQRVTQPRKGREADSTQHPMHMEHNMQQEHHMHHSTQSHTMSVGNRVSTSHFLSPSLPMNRNGSGTSWSPDAAPMYMYMYMYMTHAGKWMYMLHGNLFIRYNKQDLAGKGNRGNDRIDAPNMIMAMGQRQVGKRGLFHFSTMLSLDAIFTSQRGYPLLFQTGESAHGQPLVDRQHPHDLFSELSVSYAYSFSPKTDAYIYLGYPGEPALGATTFMHRASGMDNPDAPLSHHWVDATHITFGVATLGVRHGKFRLEGSSFTGREPGENRYDFDRPRFDSRSLRLWYAPGRSWTMQVSHGFLKSPEALHPGADIYRSTASVSYSKNFGGEKFFNATALWGMNKLKSHAANHAALAEAALRANRLVAYGRYEWVQKPTEELALDEQLYGHDHLYNVHALMLGAGYDVLRAGAIRTSLGVQGTLYHTPQGLEGLYGSHPLAGEVYLRVYPSLMR